MEINHSAFTDLLVLAKMKEQDPLMAQFYTIFTKRGISVAETMIMLSEIIELLTEAEKRERNKRNQT